MAESEIIREGWMKKRGNRVKTMWGERYFILRGPVLSYYLKATDSEPKGSIILNINCKISQIRSDTSKKRKQFVFEITWPIEEEQDESKDKKKLPKKKDSDKTPTIGNKTSSGANGGMISGAMGYIFGSSSNQTNNNPEREKQMVLACDSHHEAELWVSVLEAQLREMSDNLLGLSFTPGNLPLATARRHLPPPDVRLEEVEEWIRSSRWRVFSVFEGVRIFEHSTGSAEDRSPSSYSPASQSLLAFQGLSFFQSLGLAQIPNSAGPPCLRVNVTVNGSATDVFTALTTCPPGCRTGILRTLNVIEVIDNYVDIIHLVLEPVYLPPSWTAPRDFCLMRYWRHNSDGSYVICYDSVSHIDCPLVTGYLRGELHAAYLIAPPKGDDDEENSECQLSFIGQMDVKGWVPRAWGYQHLFLQTFCMHVLDIRDCIDSEKFVQVHFDPSNDNKDRADLISPTDSPSAGSEGGPMATLLQPPLTLPAAMWSEADASTFKVRGQTYNQDKVKVSSDPSLFRLVCVDVFEVPEATHNIASHPRNRVAQAFQKGEDFWVFVVNIMVPGTPCLSFVCYFLGDKSLIEADTPFGRIARPFFHGNDDEFRNNRFKLIPKVVDGNMIVKMAVKDTPTLLGNKLKQYYYKADHYFELDVDVGSSSVARNVVGIAIGYSKAIVVDMGFCLQGNEEDELPEVLFGSVSAIHVDMGLGKKL